MELREKIVEAICQSYGANPSSLLEPTWFHKAADAIITIPEIAEALLAAARTRFLDAMGEDVDLSDLPNP